MGRISDWLDNFLMGGDEGKFVDVTSIEQKIDIDKHLEAGRLRIEEARKENKKEEDAEEGLKFVIDGAKIKCDLCTVPEGDLKVNFDTPTIQDKKVATVVEKDMKSLIFKGNCKKSPNSSSPCASVMKLADWKDVGTVYFQDEFPLLLKSTIKCEYGGVSIKITDSAQRNEVEKINTTGVPVPGLILDFDIKFELDKTEKTIVPFGILDFENKTENPFFSFKYTLSKSKIDSLNFQIMDDDDTVIYQMTHLETVIVKASKKPEILFEAKKPTEGPLISKTWDYQGLYREYALFEPDDYTQVGEYYIHWDGFDNDEIYDSTRFNGKDLKAKITAVKGGMQKSIVVDFSTKYSQVNWTDVKIDRNAKRIDVTLRVNLTDGGAEGLSCWNNTRNFNPPHTKSEICDWDKISNEALVYYKKSPITSRTKTYEDLEKLTLEGINQFWSRNSKNIGNSVKIVLDNYEVYVDAISDKKGLSAPSIIYQTNTEESRSRNFELSRKLFFYEGYLYRDYWEKRPTTDLLYTNKGWQYVNADIEDYKMVSAHEIGHEILLTYGGHIYSKTHKGTSHWSMIIQDPNDEATNIPIKGEIDLMKYYINYYDIPRTIISEFDLLKVIWLTKIIIKPL